MKNSKINYSLAQSTWNSEEIKALEKVSKSGNFTMGENVKAFEKSFASYFGSKYAIMVNSGSSANLLAIASLFYRKENPFKVGDEVIVPAVSWSTSYSPLQQYGLKLKFVDIDLNTLNYNIEELEKAISDKTKLILIVNLLGNPNDFSKIKSFIKNKEILLLEDNCESMGAKYDNKYTGTIGEIGTFSMFFSHHICTMEGGMILTDNLELYHIMLSLRAHGWTRNLPKKNTICVKDNDEFKESFKFILPGYNLRPLELSAAVGIIQLEKLKKFIKIRRNNAKIFQDLFSSFDNIIIQKEIQKSSWFGFSIIIKNHEEKRKVILDILNKSGIETRPIVSGNILKNPMLKYFNYEVFGNIVNAEIISNNGFFVGNSHLDLEKELKFLKNILYESLY